MEIENTMDPFQFSKLEIMVLSKYKRIDTLIQLISDKQYHIMNRQDVAEANLDL